MTLFLFKAIGLHFLIIGISILLNKKTYSKIIKELSKEPGLLNFVFGFITLIVGILMVVAHNKWGNFPEVMVSLYGWIALIKGSTLLIAPQSYKKIMKNINNDNFLKFTASIYLGFGLYICYAAFIQ